MKKNAKMFLVACVVAALSGVLPTLSFAEKAGFKADAKEAAHDSARAARKAGRKVKDEVCEMVNGKMKCVAKKIKHEAQNAGDKVKDAIE